MVSVFLLPQAGQVRVDSRMTTAAHLKRRVGTADTVPGLLAAGDAAPEWRMRALCGVSLWALSVIVGCPRFAQLSKAKPWSCHRHKP